MPQMHLLWIPPMQASKGRTTCTPRSGILSWQFVIVTIVPSIHNRTLLTFRPRCCGRHQNTHWAKQQDYTLKSVTATLIGQTNVRWRHKLCNNWRHRSVGPLLCCCLFDVPLTRCFQQQSMSMLWSRFNSSLVLEHLHEDVPLWIG